jgi:hypothetical protein
MAGHSRSKNGIASLAYVPAIHVFDFARLLRRGCPRRQVYAACASLAASAGMTTQAKIIVL